MRVQRPWWSGLVAAVLGGLVGVTVAGAGSEQFIPVLSMREGAVKGSGIPFADGYIAYLTLLNERDGGINGVPLVWEFCETVFDVDRGMECYERLKTKGSTGAAAFQPFSTAITNALIEWATLDQKVTWLRVKVAQPDWVILRSTSGVMTTAALKEAAQVGFPRDKIVGVWWACSEQDMVPAGEAALGYICANFHGTGTHFPLIQDVLKHVYAQGKGPGPESDVGTAYWLRGMLSGFFTTEALRRAMREFGNQPLTGAQVQWGLEHLAITPAYIKEIGAEGLIPPLTLSCRDHEGGGSVRFQQWDGKQWTVITDWIAPDQALVRPLVEASAAKYAQEKGSTLRTCP